MIETIYIENQIRQHQRTDEILSKFKKKIDVVYCDHYGEIFNIKSQKFQKNLQMFTKEIMHILP